jgi:hypothetical protein
VADDLFGGIHDVHYAAVGAQILKVEDVLSFGDGQLQAVQGIGAAAGGGDGDGQAVFGGVIDDCADAPDAAGGGFEFGKVRLPDRLRTVGGSRNTLRRSTAQDLRSARKPCGSSNPRRRSAHATEELVTSWPSARISAAILR